MAELRLDQLERAMAAAPIDAVESSNGVSSNFMTLDELDLFGNDQEIDRKSYDLWYEKALEGMTNSKVSFLDAPAEMIAGGLNFVPDITNKTVLGVTGALGNVIESFSSREKFVENFGELGIVQNVKDIGALAADTANLIFGDDPREVKEARSRALTDAIFKRDQARRDQFRDPTAIDPEKEFALSPDANIAERLGKNMRALSFYGYANTKAFQQQLAGDADHPVLQQVGGAFGSISTSALLASVNPQLAMWAIGGHVGANQYLEQVSRGVDWKPALGYSAFIGAGVSQLERMSINLLFKKYSSRLALAGDAAIINTVEEFSQSVFEAGTEQFVGSEDRTLGEILKQASFEAALGFIGGGVAGATTVQVAYSRMDQALTKAGVTKPNRHQIIMRTIADGSNILETVLRQGLGAHQDDLDIVNQISSGKINATQGLAELNKRIMARQKAKGVDTYLDSDPDALIVEQKRADAAEKVSTRPTVSLTPDEQVDIRSTLSMSEADALKEVANFVASHELTAQTITDPEGNVQAIVNPGMPAGLQGHTTKEIEAVVKNVASGKKLTANQEQLKLKMLEVAGQMGVNLQAAGGPTAPTRIDVKETALLRAGREKQINQELDLLEEQRDAVSKEINQRKEEGKPTAALEKQREQVFAEIESLLDEIDLLPTAEREALASKLVTVKGKKISSLRNQAEVVAARIEKERLVRIFKQEKADLNAAREELSKYVREAFKGLDTPKKFVTRVAKVTPKNIDKFMAEVDEARVAIVRPALVGQINKVLGRVAPKVEGGKAAGVLKSASLQDVANELIRVSKIDSQTARQLLASKQQLLTNYFKQSGEDNAVSGEVNVDRLNFEMEVLQNLAGLDGKNEDELMASLVYARDKVALLKTGAKIRQEQLREQREQERITALSQMKKKAPNLITKWAKGLNHYGTSNLGAMLRDLVSVKDVDGSVLGKKIATVSEADRKEASFNYLYMNGLKDVSKRVYGLKNDKEYNNWLTDRYKEGGGYDTGGEIEFNNGKTGRLLLSKADISYWWLVTHDKNGNELPEMIEQFTGENARQALEEKAEEGVDEDAEGDVEGVADVDLSQIKGNAIPIDQWQDMMVKFESDPRNVEFAQSQRVFYNTVYSLINPVYRLYMGIDLPRVEDYIPWHRDVRVDSDLFSALDDFQDLIQTTPRSTKLRTPGATAAFRQVGDTEIFQYFIQEMAHFNAFALPMKDLISFIRDKDVRLEINRRTDGVELSGGVFKDGDSYKNIRRMADFIMSRGRSMNEFTLGFFNTMRSNISVAYLGEPSKGIMQTSSMWMALSEKDITWGDWMAGFAEFMSSPAETIKLLESAPLMKFRYKHLMTEMKEAIERITIKGEAKVDRFRRFITPKAFTFIRAGDKVGAGISGYIIFRKVFNETGDIHEAFRRFDEHVKSTQQSALATQLSPIQIGTSNRMISQFWSAAIQFTRIYTQAWGDVFRGRIPVKKFVDILILFHVVMPTMRWMLKALIRGGDFDDDELKKDMIIGPLTAGLFIPDLIEGIVSAALSVHAFSSSPAAMTAMDEITKTARKVKKGVSEALQGDHYDAADLAVLWVELAQDVSTPFAPVPGITFDAVQAMIRATQGEMTPEEILSVMLGESVESLEFKNKKGNNRRDVLFGR